MGADVSKPTDPSLTLRVIGAGYSRTGTVSLSFALSKLLNGPVMHGGSQLLGREDAYVHLWTRIFSAHARHDRALLLKLLREATAGFVAITDAPGNCFVAELLELYPDAQVVCVRRDQERWWQSWKTVSTTAAQGFLAWYFCVVPGKRWWPGLARQFLDQQERQFGPMGPARMDEHNAYVKAVTPREKFHMMDLSQGWEPLCDLLGTPVPDEPFPRTNDADAIERLAGSIMLEAAWRWAVIGAVIGGTLFWCYRVLNA